MKLPITRTLLAVLTLATAALAADIAGKWTAMVPGRQGQARETTFTFKVDGEKLTGTMTGQQGDQPIADGKVSGDKISFVRESQRGKQSFTGTITGDEIKFKRTMDQGEPVEFVAKRAK
ncbi:MAG: hypothetical protein HYX27_05040 [Acidobacteria bacterium]|nr:hypothetical protein [Acidobacteriota bacterium]